MSMKIQRIRKEDINDDATVSIKEMGHTYEICWCEHKNDKAPIQKIDKDHYLITATGEVKQCRHIKNRYQSKGQLAQSFKRLREIINTNATNVNNCRWLTLTYREHITDTKQAYNDFDKFIKRLRYKYGNLEYINVCEPQGNGRWHFHCLIIFPSKAPYIPNDEMAEIWGHGFTKTQKLDNRIDNIGAYLSAHISDMEIEEADSLGIEYGIEDIKEITKIDNQQLENPKYYIKGARLSLYPPKFNLYRTSRGIKKPVKEYMTYKQAKEKIGLDQPTYSKSVKLTDTDGKFSNKITYEHYNMRRKKKHKKIQNTDRYNTKNNKKHHKGNKVSKHTFFLSHKNAIFTRVKRVFNKVIDLCVKRGKRLKLPHKKRE